MKYSINRPLPTQLCLSFVKSLLIMTLAAAPFAEGHTTTEQPDVITETAAVRGDWSTVLARLSAGDQRTLPASAKLVLAHASLALNRNNDAAFLFMSATTNDIVEWSRWTESLAGRFGQVTMAGYFRADAMARMGQPREAIRELSRVLAAEPKNVLALNARGVIYASLTNHAAALEDFLAAIGCNSSISDFWNNCAALGLDSHEGARAALKDVDQAIKLNPSNALALYHRGCLQLILHLPEAAEADLVSARRLAPQLAPWVREAKAKAIAALAPNGQSREAKPGFQITAESAQIQAITKGWNPPELKSAIGNAQNANEMNLVLSAAKVGANGDPAKLAQISTIYNSSKNDHVSAGIFAKSESSGNVSINATVGIKGIGSVVGGSTVGVKDTYEYPGLKPAYEAKTKAYSDMDNMLKSSPKVNPSGFDAAQRDAVSDSYDWPFLPIYALSYSRQILQQTETPIGTLTK